MLVRGIATFRDDAFPAFGARVFPRLLDIVERSDACDWQLQRDLREDLAAFDKRERHHVASVDPEHVEDVIVRLALTAPRPRRFAIEDHVVHGELRYRAKHGRMLTVERQLVAREQPDLVAVLEGEHANAVELALER